MMSKWDYEIAVAVWLASMIATYFFQPAALFVVCATVNLWHQRNVLYRAGDEFETRVKKTLTDQWTRIESRVVSLEKQFPIVEKKASDAATVAHNISTRIGPGPRIGSMS